MRCSRLVFLARKRLAAKRVYSVKPSST